MANTWYYTWIHGNIHECHLQMQNITWSLFGWSKQRNLFSVTEATFAYKERKFKKNKCVLMDNKAVLQAICGLHRANHPYKINALIKKARISLYLVNEIPDVPRVRSCRSDRVLRLGVNGPLIQSSDSYRLDGIRFHSIRLLKLAQVIVLQKTKPKIHDRCA